MNNWSITGNLGQDPHLRVTPTGTPVLNLSVALRVRMKGQDGKWTDETEWVDVTMFGTRCEALHNILHKGQRVGASGEMRIRRYVNKQGESKSQVELIAHDIEPLERRDQAGEPRTSRPMQDGYTRQGGGGGAGQRGGQGGGQGGYRQPEHRERQGQFGGAAYGHQGGGNRQGNHAGGAPGPGYDGFDPDDDIPF